MRNLSYPPIAETRLNSDWFLKSSAGGEILLPALLDHIQDLEEEKNRLQVLIGELLVKNQALRERLITEDNPEVSIEAF